MAHLERLKEFMWYTGTADSTELIRVSLPALVSNLPFQPGNRAPILSINTCSSALLVRKTQILTRELALFSLKKAEQRFHFLISALNGEYL
jgi:hypothetical protein